jgi:Transposase, Mutator family
MGSGGSGCCGAGRWGGHARDWAATFDPVIVPKGQRRMTEFDDMVVSLYAKGLMTRDIAEHLQQTHWAKACHLAIGADVTGRRRARDVDRPCQYCQMVQVRRA